MVESCHCVHTWGEIGARDDLSFSSWCGSCTSPGTLTIQAHTTRESYSIRRLWGLRNADDDESIKSQRVWPDWLEPKEETGLRENPEHKYKHKWSLGMEKNGISNIIIKLNQNKGVTLNKFLYSMMKISFGKRTKKSFIRFGLVGP